MHVGIIGGGMMGLTTGYYLNKKGIHATILEKENEVGGLSTSVEILPGFYWDRFYHVILSTDEELLNFLDEIGLSLEVRFRETKTGFYKGGKFYSMSNTMEFLKFKPLSFFDKLRLGVGILYSSKINNWKRLEKIYVKTWLIRVFGRRNYEKLWDPLLRSKLGSVSNQTSAAFIWSTIKRYYGTRQSSTKKEMMGCVKGGYYSILNHLFEHHSKNGIRILTNCPIERVELQKNSCIKVYSRQNEFFEFDRVIATTPNPITAEILPEMPLEFRSKLESVKYLSVICAALVLKHSLTPFYVTNLLDNKLLPFTGLIEASNVMPVDLLNGRALVYLPKYLPLGDPFYEKTDEEIFEVFIKALKHMFPDFNEGDIISKKLHREPYVQPIQEVGYSENIPPIKTPLENFYLVNTAMILNSTLNNNEVIKLARKAADLVEKD